MGNLLLSGVVMTKACGRVFLGGISRFNFLTHKCIFQTIVHCYSRLFSRGAGKKVFLFSWRKYEVGQQEPAVSSKAVAEDLNIRFRSNFYHGFTNHGFQHCAILKALHGFKEKIATRQKICNFSFKLFKMRFSRC